MWPHDNTLESRNLVVSIYALRLSSSFKKLNTMSFSCSDHTIVKNRTIKNRQRKVEKPYPKQLEKNERENREIKCITFNICWYHRYRQLPSSSFLRITTQQHREIENPCGFNLCPMFVDFFEANMYNLIFLLWSYSNRKQIGLELTMCRPGLGSGSIHY